MGKKQKTRAENGQFLALRQGPKATSVAKGRAPMTRPRLLPNKRHKKQLWRRKATAVPNFSFYKNSV
jgi:hypothetical protein